MSEVISISKCEIELMPGTKPYLGTPIANRGSSVNQMGELTTFRVTSSDELNMIVGLVSWKDSDPEVVPIDILSGLDKHNELKQRGRMSIGNSKDGNWLVTLSVLKYSAGKDRFTLHGGHLTEINEFLGQDFKALLLEVGALRVGARSEIDGETSKSASHLAAVIKPGDIRTLAVAYTVTRPLAVINDFGLNL